MFSYCFYQKIIRGSCLSVQPQKSLYEDIRHILDFIKEFQIIIN